MAARRSGSRRSSRIRKGVWYDVGSSIIDDFDGAPINPFSPGVPVPPPNPPGTGYPNNLTLFWKSEDYLKSKKGSSPVYSGVPAADSEGVSSSSGLSFPDSVSSPGTLVVKFTAKQNSVDLVGEQHLFGPIYISAEGLLANDGTNKVKFPTVWNSGDVVTTYIQVQNNQIRVGRHK